MTRYNSAVSPYHHIAVLPWSVTTLPYHHITVSPYYHMTISPYYHDPLLPCRITISPYYHDPLLPCRITISPYHHDPLQPCRITMTFRCPLLETRCFLLHFAFGVKTFAGLYFSWLRVFKNIKMYYMYISPPPPKWEDPSRQVSPQLVRLNGPENCGRV
jgi:hypothetical protein